MGGQAAIFLLRPKGLDRVRVKHFLDVTEGSKDRGIITSEGNEKA